jgi:hypothetical protein
MRPAAVLLPMLLSFSALAAGGTEERLFAAPPPGWTPAFQDFKDGQRVHEYLPPGQNLGAWTERVTIRIFEGLTGVAAVDFAQRMAETVRKTCERYEGHPPDNRRVNGYEVSLVLLECRRPVRDPTDPRVVPRRIEVLMATVIRGREAIYVVQRAWRGDQPGGGHPFYAGEAREAWLRFMGTVELCDLADRAAPCKSLGMPSHEEALAFMRPFRDQIAEACAYVRVLAVRPDTGRPVTPRRTVPMILGAKPFGDAEEERKIADLIVRSAQANTPVAVVLAVARGSAATPAEAALRGAAGAKALAEALEARGLPSDRLAERPNPDCGAALDGEAPQRPRAPRSLRR